MAVLISKGNLHRKVVLEAARQLALCTRPPNLTRFYGGPGFSHIHGAGVLNITSLSQGCDLGGASGSRKGKENAHSKDRGWGEERPVAGVQLTVQPAVPSLL